jgi:hypothetical protein
MFSLSNGKRVLIKEITHLSPALITPLSLFWIIFFLGLVKSKAGNSFVISAMDFSRVRGKYILSSNLKAQLKIADKTRKDKRN